VVIEEEERRELSTGEEKGSSSDTGEKGNFRPVGPLAGRRETGVKAKTVEERTLPGSAIGQQRSKRISRGEARLVPPWTEVLPSRHLLTPDTLPLHEEEQTGAHRLRGALRGA